MNLRFIFAFVLFCFASTVLSQDIQARCQIRFFPSSGISNLGYIFYDGDDVAPFNGWSWVDVFTGTWPVSSYEEGAKNFKAYSSLRAVQVGNCWECTLTVYSRTDFSGNSETYDFSQGSEYEFPFCAKSLRLDCADL